MTRFLLILTVMVLTASSIVADVISEEAYKTPAYDVFADVGMARSWCDESMLDPLEGIWDFPGDDTTVLIKLRNGNSDIHDIIILETPDTRLKPGDIIGRLSSSPDPNKFEIELFRIRLDDAFVLPGKAVATFNVSTGALTVERRRLDFTLNSRWLLPSFWRFINVKDKNLSKTLPSGLVKKYPAPPKRTPDYL